MIGRLLSVAALIAVAAAAAWTVRAARTAQRLLRPARVRVTSKDRREAAAALPGLADLELQTSDGLRLQGWFAPGPRGDAVIFVHGLGGNRTQLLAEAAVLARHGHGVLLYDSRASGESDGDLATWGDQERLDVAAAVSWLQQRLAAPVGVFGFSVGASAAVLRAAVDPAVAAVALGPTWTSLEDELADKFPRRLSRWITRAVFDRTGVDVSAVRPIDAVGSIPPRPLLLVIGDKDPDTPVRSMERLRERATGATLWVVPGAGHGGFAVAAPGEVDARLGGFFDGALSAEPPRPASTR